MAMLDAFGWTLAMMRGAIMPPACVPGLTGKVYTVPVNSPDPIPRVRAKRAMVAHADTPPPATVGHVTGEAAGGFMLLMPFPLDARLARFRCLCCGHEMLLSRRRVKDGMARCPSCLLAEAKAGRSRT
ncbi:hypothetical protein [Cupriavidus oxalaticus]|uniref:Uncharacterized protein n=1 Tax=Cupriavidus oxalaticus TaxID=96344 RepID=A0A5P3VRI0_9BURK|nr:hypothetical protein [Cupriavidus oxalaticus]QEZ48956.1 hypothetical protein D2917_32360 [Cupriavidus oxalaticus]